MRLKFYILLIVIVSFSCKRKPVQTALVNSEVKGGSQEISSPSNRNSHYPSVKISRADSIKQLKDNYWKVYGEIKEMLEDKKTINFKRAVFITENAYLNNNINYDTFCLSIKQLVDLSMEYQKRNSLIAYKYDDIVDVAKNGAIFKVMTDTIMLTTHIIGHLPFTYDFDDFMGNKDWTKMFVTKLLYTNSGNCHSLPYLYKILTNEVGTKTYLALAPNHIYIKQRNKQLGWYNTELTSATFPVDGWLAASGYISLDAIRSGIFMDTLSNKQTICICLNDLAEGYKRKFGVDSSFILSCTNLALKYYPNSVNALILKGETLKLIFERKMQENNAKYPSEIFYNPQAKYIYDEMEKSFVTAAKLGYREMPESMYLDWLSLVQKEKEKYQNKNIQKN